MQRSPRPELAESVGFRPVSRGQSYSSDGPASWARSPISQAPPASFDPVYISAFAAAQWVASELEMEDITVTPAAVSLLNSFLDQILFSILSAAGSTGLPQLRDAVPEVLKAKLGKEAIASADEELREYLGDDQEGIGSEVRNVPDHTTNFNLELAWKLARLRCMVYTRLGDLEEDDALDIIENEHLDEQGDQHLPHASHSSSVTPAGAIFLTSVIEYLGEQALYYSAVVAQKRQADKLSRDAHSVVEELGSPGIEGLILEESDIRQLRFHGPLVRLWRNWKRPTRSSHDLFTRAISPESQPKFGSPQPASGGARSLAVVDDGAHAENQVRRDPYPHEIPLPMTANDVNEIEVPGLARELDQNDLEVINQPQHTKEVRRPASMDGRTHSPNNAIPTPQPSTVHRLPSASRESRPQLGRHRSHSLPTPPQSPFTSARETECGQNHQDHENLQNDTANGNLADGPDESRQPGADLSSDDPPPAPQPFKRHGLVLGTIASLAGAVGLGSLGLTASATNNESNHPPTKEFVAETMLHPGPSISDRDSAPLETSTEKQIHEAKDFPETDVPVVPPGSNAPLTPPGDTDPEDLALSSADEAECVHEPQAPQVAPQNASLYQPTDSTNCPEWGPNGNKTRELLTKDAVATPSILTQPKIEEKAAASDTTPFRDVKDSNESRSSLSGAEYENNKPAILTSEPAWRKGHSRNGESKSSEYSHHSKSSSNSSRLLGFNRDSQGHPLPSLANERLSAQRAEARSPVKELHGARHGQSASVGSSREIRPATSASQQSASKPPLRIRTSSEDSGEPRRTTFDEPEDTKKSLDVLIRGDETLHYTLTPKTAREIETPESPRRNKTQTQDLADFLRNTGPPEETGLHPIGSQHTSARSLSSMKGSVSGLRAHPPIEESRSNAPSTIAKGQSESARVAPQTKAGSQPKAKIGEAREAQIKSSTTRDLADYLRSTGPENDEQLTLPLSSRPGTAATAKENRVASPPPDIPKFTNPGEPVTVPPPRVAPASGASPMAPTHSLVNGNSRSVTAASRQSGPRPEPREAKIPNTAQTNALIDFIREGPPRATGEHRIPRTIAPFRRTMDSDDLNGLSPKEDKDQPGRSSLASTQDSSNWAQSVQSSMNSNTALLESSRQANSRSTNGVGPITLSVAVKRPPEVGSTLPKRKQRAVRDPYAIDYSDDDMDNEVITLKPKSQEESLIDFLRNTAPPATMATPRPILTPASVAAAQASAAQREAGVSNLKDKLIRKTSVQGLTKTASSNVINSNTTSQAETGQSPAYFRGLKAARAESPQLSQKGSKLGNYKPTQFTHAAHADQDHQKAPSVAPVIQSKSDRILGVGSKPPPAVQLARPIAPQQLMPPGMQKDESGFLAFFSRRRSVRK